MTWITDEAVEAAKRMLEDMDENGCFTAPNGDCISEGPCQHTPTLESVQRWDWYPEGMDKEDEGGWISFREYKASLTACQQEVGRLRGELIKSRNYWSEQCSDLNQRNAELVKALEEIASDDERGDYEGVVQFARNALASHEPAPTDTQEEVVWQPIETAPKGSEMFLTYAPPSNDFPDGRTIIVKGSILASMMAEGTPSHLAFPATHWMPLPVNPAAGEQ